MRPRSAPPKRVFRNAAIGAVCTAVIWAAPANGQQVPPPLPAPSSKPSAQPATAGSGAADRPAPSQVAKPAASTKPAPSGAKPPPPPPPPPYGQPQPYPAGQPYPPYGQPPPYSNYPQPQPYPPYPQSQPYPAPTAQNNQYSAEPPQYLPYPDLDAPVPAGYKVDSRPNSGLIGIGVGMLTAGWATTAFAAALAADYAQKNPGDVSPDAWTPMYFPVAGPFVTLASIRPGPAETGLLLCSGIFQTAGFLGILLGSLRQTHRLVRIGSLPALEVTPAIGLNTAALSASGQF